MRKCWKTKPLINGPNEEMSKVQLKLFNLRVCSTNFIQIKKWGVNLLILLINTVTPFLECRKYKEFSVKSLLTRFFKGL